MKGKSHGRKPDRMLKPGSATPAANAIWAALQPLDEAERHCARKWGIGRLIKVVPPELASKFGAANGRLDDALDRSEGRKSDIEDIVKHATNLIKGWRAMDAWAEEHDVKPIADVGWVTESPGGKKYCITRDKAAATFIEECCENHTVYTLDEIGHILEWWGNGFGASIENVKEAFPGATFKAIPKEAAGEFIDDEIPF